MESDEVRRMLLFEENFPSQDYYDLGEELLRIKIEGTYLEPEVLAELKLSLFTILAIQSFILKRPVYSYPLLHQMAEKLLIPHDIPKRVDRIIDERGEIRDDASATLKKIRKDKINKQAVVEAKINQTLKRAAQSGWTSQDSGVSVRDGRLVIPVLSKYKRQMGGLVHDESSTGQTLYIEPAEVVEVNNEIRELEFAERREIIRILVEFTSILRPFQPLLMEAYQFLGYIDFLRAKAQLAISMRGTLPKERLNYPYLRWREALHPLLYLAHSKAKKTVVPLNLKLDEISRILIISGPNSGGKSVCLKTVGLVQYMYQCGILPPVDEDSTFGLFRNIFIDIGDEQSLENDLSTYTSKLLNLKFFLENVDENSLFLIDEMGTGTDPSLGGPIAEASLEKMNEHKAFGVVTTHYSNLKLLAGRFQGFENGAMLYDSKRMKPLFQLQVGLPGSSFAFEIATQIGFPDDVLRLAADKTGKTQLDFDRQLQDLEFEKSELVKRSTEIRVADEFLDSLIKKYTKLTEEVERSKKEILQKAKDDALRLLGESNKLIEKTVKEIKEHQAEKEKTKEARVALEEFKEKILNDEGFGRKEQSRKKDPSIPSNAKKEVKPEESTFETKLNSLVQHFKTTPAEDQKKGDQGTEVVSKPTYRGPYQSIYNELQSKLAQFQLTLDLRGKRAEESISMLQHYIDDAILLNMTEVRILHGKGNGVLRQITRDYLRSIKEVKRCMDAPLESGGAGITVVQFR